LDPEGRSHRGSRRPEDAAIHSASCVLPDSHGEETGEETNVRSVWISNHTGVAHAYRERCALHGCSEPSSVDAMLRFQKWRILAWGATHAVHCYFSSQSIRPTSEGGARATWISSPSALVASAVSSRGVELSFKEVHVERRERSGFICSETSKMDAS